MKKYGSLPLLSACSLVDDIAMFLGKVWYDQPICVFQGTENERSAAREGTSIFHMGMHIKKMMKKMKTKETVMRRKKVCL